MRTNDSPSETETLHTMSETKSPASAALGVDAPRHEPAYVLAFDTANEVIAIGVGVLHEEARAIELVAHAEIEARRQSNTQLIPRIDALLAENEIARGEIACVCVGRGPGSFTGVRIGVSTVKALAHAANKPCVAVDALEALAANVTAFDGVVCPILDARAQQVYGAIFKRGERLTEDTVEKLTLFLDRVEATGEDALFLGDGAPGFEAAIRERLGDKAHFAQPQHNGLRAGSACALAARRLEAGETQLDYITLLPLYLRAPQAERERAAREGAKHG